MTCNVFGGTLNLAQSNPVMDRYPPWSQMWLGTRSVLWHCYLGIWNKLYMICIWSSWCHCFIKIQSVQFTFLTLAYPGCPAKEAIKQVAVVAVLKVIHTINAAFLVLLFLMPVIGITY